MSTRYDPAKRLAALQADLDEETRVLARLRETLRTWKPTDKRGWTHYDHANFFGTSKGDIEVAIARVEVRIRDIRRRMAEAARDEDDLVY